MKVKLLNNGGYWGMDNVFFPVIVDAKGDDMLSFVPRSELVRIGANGEKFMSSKEYTFSIGVNAEVCDE